MKTFKIYFYSLLSIICTNLYSQSYLPLESGNKWFFKHGECSGSPVYSQCDTSILVSNVTADSVMPNGLRYFSVGGIFIGLEEWFRSDTNWVYVYSYQDSLGFIDLPIFNLHSNVGEIYNYGKEYYQTTTLVTRDTLIIFNEKIEVLEFNLETGLDVSNKFKLSEKFGFIKHDNIGYGGWSYSNLIGCIINRKSYGYVTNVEQNENVIPLKIELHQNYPNPFNPTTSIGFGIAEKTNVRLAVLNVLGEEIKVLLNEEKEVGYHSINFTGSDLPSGIYFYSIQAVPATSTPKGQAGQVFIDTKKMILLK